MTDTLPLFAFPRRATDPRRPPTVARPLALEPGALAGARVLQTLADALERLVGLRRG